MDKSADGLFGIILRVTTTLAILIRPFKSAAGAFVFCSDLPAVVAPDQLNLAAFRALEPGGADSVCDSFLA